MSSQRRKSGEPIQHNGKLYHIVYTKNGDPRCKDENNQKFVKCPQGLAQQYGIGNGSRRRSSQSPTRRKSPSKSPTRRKSPSKSPTRRKSPSKSPTRRLSPSVKKLLTKEYIPNVGVRCRSPTGEFASCLKETAVGHRNYDNVNREYGYNPDRMISRRRSSGKTY
jgi:hypothetical protein